MDVECVANPSFHPTIYCNDAGFSPRILLNIQLLSSLLCLEEDNKEAPRMLFSESLGRYAFVHKDWNFLSLPMGGVFQMVTALGFTFSLQSEIFYIAELFTSKAKTVPQCYHTFSYVFESFPPL